MGWTREALAFHSGLSWSAIAQIESGRRTNVRPRTLSVLSDALGVTVDYLLGREARSGSMLEHHALFYATQDELLDTAESFITQGLERSEVTLAVTSAPAIKRLRKQLGSRAADVTFADARHWYSTPTGALAAYHAFAKQQLDRGAGWIRILGEPVWSGKTSAEVRLWTRYESLLNLEFAGLPVTVVCPYDTASLDPEIVEQARVTHQNSHSHGEITGNPQYRAPGDFTLEP